MPFATGTRLGPYEITAVIGAGGMGEVYRARDPRLGRDVAIKVLTERFARDPQAVARFEREARAVAALSHPNIVAIYDIGSENGVIYVVTELLEGETLRVRLRQGAIPWRIAAESGAALADGLAAAHSKGVIHRDVKPENLFLTSDRRVKILDFGLARTEQPAAGDETLTQAGMVMGTVGYMSPEQVRGVPASQASDIFSLGCVLYEMVAGRRAFDGQTAAETMTSILRDAPPQLRVSMKDIPSTVERLILRCLEKPLENRFASAREVASGLRGALQETVRGEASQPANSIAVLPFANASRDPDGEYLSDGITESIINSLARLAQLKVAPRSTVFRYKGQDADPQGIGRDLRVRVVLTGRVLQRGETLVVSAELIDVAEGSQLWGERYNRKVADVFELEEEIARKISESLRVKLTGDDEKRLAKRQTENSEAYQLYLKGRHHWVRRTPDHLAKGAEYFQQAIEKDPGYALAYAGMADCHSILACYVFVPPKESWARAKAAAAAAVALDADLAEAHASLGFIRVFADWDYAAGERELLRAIELNPGYAVSLYWYVLLLVALGRLEEAELQYLRSQEAEPLSPVVAFGGVLTSICRRRYQEGIDRALKGLDLDPHHPLLNMWLGIAYQQLGQQEEALRVFRRCSELLPNTSMGIAPLAHELALSGRREEARQLLAQAVASAERGLSEHFSLTLICLGLGETEEAFRWMDKACQARYGLGCFVIKTDPRLDPLRADPRFQTVLERMGLAG